MALALIKALSASLKLADLSTAAKSQQNVREKLATTFLALMKTNRVADNGPCKLDTKLTREEFASIIGSTMETVSRLITEFKDAGLINEQGKILYVINEEKLKIFAGNQ